MSRTNVWLPQKRVSSKSTSSEFAATGPIIGIDLGTTNSCIAIWHPEKNRAKIIKNVKEQRLTPSTVAFGNSFDDVIVGQSALECSHPILVGTKAFIGQSGANTSTLPLPPELSIDQETDRILLNVEDAKGHKKSILPEAVSTHILAYLKHSAEIYLYQKPVKNLPSEYSYTVEKKKKKKSAGLWGKKQAQADENDKIQITRCVIGIPACFTEQQREATRLAAMQAGFLETHLMIESSAAAMAYGLLTAGSKTILVFDIGGGTTDVTIMEVTEGSFSIAATGGQSDCGGEAMDRFLLELILEKIGNESGLGLQGVMSLLHGDGDGLANNSERKRTQNRLLALARQCKETLTSKETVLATLPNECFHISSNLTSKLQCTISRLEFDESISKLLSLIKEVVCTVVSEFFRMGEKNLSSSTPSTSTHTSTHTPSTARNAPKITIDEIILVGGTSHIPSVRKAVRSALSDSGIHWYKDGSSLTAKAGAAQGEFCCSIDPHEAVAQGLAIRGGILMGVDQGKLKDLLMLDVCPKTLGILSVEMVGDEERKFFEPVLNKSTRLPAKGVCRFLLADSLQRFVTVSVYEEVDRLVPRADVTPSMNTNMQSLLSQDEGSDVQYVVEYDYRLMCTYDFPVADFPIDSQNNESGARRYAYVEINMSEEGDTAVSVHSGERPAGPDSKDGEKTTAVMMGLMAYLVVLGVLYLVVKMLVIPKPEYPPSSKSDL